MHSVAASKQEGRINSKLDFEWLLYPERPGSGSLAFLRSSEPEIDYPPPTELERRIRNYNSDGLVYRFGIKDRAIHAEQVREGASCLDDSKLIIVLRREDKESINLLDQALDVSRSVVDIDSVHDKIAPARRRGFTYAAVPIPVVIPGEFGNELGIREYQFFLYPSRATLVILLGENTEPLEGCICNKGDIFRIGREKSISCVLFELLLRMRAATSGTFRSLEKSQSDAEKTFRRAEHLHLHNPHDSKIRAELRNAIVKTSGELHDVLSMADRLKKYLLQHRGLVNRLTTDAAPSYVMDDKDDEPRENRFFRPYMRKDLRTRLMQCVDGDNIERCDTLIRSLEHTISRAEGLRATIDQDIQTELRNFEDRDMRAKEQKSAFEKIRGDAFATILFGLACAQVAVAYDWLRPYVAHLLSVFTAVAGAQYTWARFITLRRTRFCSPLGLRLPFQRRVLYAGSYQAKD